HNDRVRELRDLNKRIDAIGILEKINNTTRCQENFIQQAEETRYYLLQYGKDHKLTIDNFESIISGALKLKEIEQKIELRGSEVKT
ncbi:hypothetical protein, partial [Mesorhizobium sp. M7A.F.Ca.MR.148.00.0.0]|uniref:hypothetical protein n=1 Tax=Mesorhizobium sp. M7A.F.Ca.MR.148.00.0.0 TaxID=2496775 RepID=UPI0019D31CDE